MSEKTKNRLGWTAVILTTIIAGIWALWGSVENFHEGWYFESFIRNIGLMFLQYLSLTMIFIILSSISLRLPRVGGSLFIGFGLYLCFFFFNRITFTTVVMITIPFTILGLFYWFGRPRPRRLAYAVIIGVPLLIILVSSIPNAIRVSKRVNDGNFDARIVTGNGVTLVWAPEGPGWPEKGVTWYDAKEICSHLSEDGTTVTDSVLNIWRLLTVDEAVRSMARHGKNAGGVWNKTAKKAEYKITPDKETPLWNVHSMVIYWWTATEADSEKAYIVTYNGGVWPRLKTRCPGYLAFRAVKKLNKISILSETESK